MSEQRKVVRCAIYTRKSTEDGLEQEYNSLDAQYDACVAYALSQRHEGWTVVSERYDDGGYSGGNMERPGLNSLLADIEAGKVDIILLYKIDRLTRSLSDFARIVDVLDKAGASFVSITQSFNTTTSMGRLTLNMLLSFAQFEREVTGERIRDKIAASKRKGIWMGGPVPLGYDVVERKLIPSPAEAETVRHIMRRYVALGSVKALVAELDRDGYRTKVQIRTSTGNKGGCPFRRGTLYHLLSNRIYLGEIVHKGVGYPGEHAPIVPTELWDEVQQALAARSQGGTSKHGTRHPSLLVQLVRDGEGRRMTPSHTCRGNRRFRYYVTRPDEIEGTAAWRVNAHDLEHIVCHELVALLSDSERMCTLVGPADAQQTQKTILNAQHIAEQLNAGSPHMKQEALRNLLDSVQLHEDHINISIDPAKLAVPLGMDHNDNLGSDPLIITCGALRVRRGHELRLIIPSSAQPAIAASRDEKLIGLLTEAHSAAKLVSANPEKSLANIAALHGRCRTRLGKLVTLSCLAPDIITAIVQGRQPATLTARRLMQLTLPVDWAGQRAMLGFA
jgi:DNA invertase Pin-like site-specific DNA recombinase